jgi:SPW repeat
MTAKRWQRWQDWLLLLAGIWLVIAPWVLDTASDADSSRNNWTIGVLVGLTALWALARPADEATGWLQALFGAWLFASPWVLSFSGLTEASWNAWLLGTGIVVVASWELIEQAVTREGRSGPIPDDIAHGSH